jgi:hypothetical protein
MARGSRAQIERFAQARLRFQAPARSRRRRSPPWERVDDIQMSLPARDRARVEHEGALISRAEYEKYLTEVREP